MPRVPLRSTLGYNPTPLRGFKITWALEGVTQNLTDPLRGLIRGKNAALVNFVNENIRNTICHTTRVLAILDT